MILLLDNFDSFTYNLHHYLVAAGKDVVVKRNNELHIDELRDYSALVLSPGPGLPADAGIMPEVIKQWPSEKPMLGVCLGLQGIVESFGGRLMNLGEVLHGRSSYTRKVVEHELLFEGIPSVFEVGHYHSWAADPAWLPECLEITALSELNVIMAIRHKSKNIRAVQFHPESVLTPDGRRMMDNWCQSF